MTPAMVDFGRELAAKKGLANVTLKQGDVTTLPFPDGFFSVVVTRYTFHHFLDPLAVFKEMCGSAGAAASSPWSTSTHRKTQPRRRSGTGWSCYAIRATYDACRWAN